MKRNYQALDQDEFDESDKSPKPKTRNHHNLKIESVIRTLCPEDFNTDVTPKQKPSKRKCDCNPYSSFVRAGPFVLGAQLSEVTQFCDIDHYIGRKIDDPDPNRYYFLKIAVLPLDKRNENHVQRQAKWLIYNEYSVLTLLKNHPGIIQVQGLYLDYFYDGETSSLSEPEYFNIDKCDKCLERAKSDVLFETRQIRDCQKKEHPDILEHHYCLNYKHTSEKGILTRRLILALDCHIPHMFYPVTPTLVHLSNKFSRFNCEYENLQEYVKRFKNIPEMKALEILAEVVEVIYVLHQKNIAHRDLRLENILYNHRNGKILLINFGLARCLIDDETCINDHRGSSAYISPDVLKRRPYPPKPSDCWALGVIFYTMLFGKFPFYADNYSDLFKKINSGNYRLPPNSITISTDTSILIRSLIEIDSTLRIDTVELRTRLKQLIHSKLRDRLRMENKTLIDQNKCVDDELQVVPDMDHPVHQNALLKHNLVLFFEKGLKLDQKPESYFYSNKAVLEAIKVLNSETNLLKDCSTFLSSIYEMIEKQNIGQLNIEHDHDYVQKNLNKPLNFDMKDDLFPNAFDAYLNSRFLSVLSPKPIPFFPMTHRFCNDQNVSIYSRKFSNKHNSLLFEEISKQRQQSNNEYDMEIQHDDHYLHHYHYHDDNRFVAIQPKDVNKSNFTVLKVDSDIRPLNEHEYNLFNHQLLRYLSFNSSNN